LFESIAFFTPHTAFANLHLLLLEVNYFRLQWGNTNTFGPVVIS